MAHELAVLILLRLLLETRENRLHIEGLMLSLPLWLALLLTGGRDVWAWCRNTTGGLRWTVVVRHRWLLHLWMDWIRRV